MPEWLDWGDKVASIIAGSLALLTAVISLCLWVKRGKVAGLPEQSQEGRGAALNQIRGDNSLLNTAANASAAAAGAFVGARAPSPFQNEGDISQHIQAAMGAGKYVPSCEVTTQLSEATVQPDWIDTAETVLGSASKLVDKLDL